MAPISANAAGAGDADPSPVERHADPKLSNTSPTDAQCPKVPIAGTPWVSEVAGTDHHEHEEPEERDRGRRADAVGHRVDRAAGRVAEVAQPGVGVEVVGEEGAEPRGARHLQLAAARSRAPAGAVGPAAATRRSCRTCSRLENQLPMAARARRGRPVSEVAERLDEPDDERRTAPARAAGAASTT